MPGSGGLLRLAALLAALWLAAWLGVPRSAPGIHLLLVVAFALLVAWGIRRAGPTRRG